MEASYLAGVSVIVIIYSETLKAIKICINFLREFYLEVKFEGFFNDLRQTCESDSAFQ